MVACEDLQTLASRAAKARNIHDVEFGGLSAIVGGDFAQLPPVSGRALYDGRIALRTTDKMTPQAQSAILVMIKANEATELCITKGQEAVVVGWDSTIGPSGKRILDVLFVRLESPPREIQIPGLPLNVVPLGRTSNHVTCLLRDDSLLSLTREQVMVLPNFAMTDYASQGKSRVKNVVHLNDSKNHHNYYVALSRGFTADGTCIIQGFDSKKITSGISGHLRQEFRELELLDEITRLRHEGRLPRRVTGIYRGQLLSSYRAWKGNLTDPGHLHPALASQHDEIDPTSDYGPWKPTIGAQKTPRIKRKAGEDEHEDTPAAKKKTMTATASVSAKVSNHTASRSLLQACGPMGLIWDGTNYSCAHDAFFAPLACLWNGNPQLWTQRLADCSPLLGLWATVVTDNREVPEEARNAVRMVLNFQNAADFPLGARGIKLDTLFTAVTDSRRSYGCCDLLRRVRISFTWRDRYIWTVHRCIQY
ncbi:hypothetical protein B0H13DRAFT_1609169 [Mycena leptocephala]|nr:hypothetical protein B0H13DRAFT_1609169 [Mycena leptocephala]